MPDREKVIKGLSEMVESEWLWRKADYWAMICRDALELLKEQEPVKPVNVHMYRKMFANVRSGYCPICNNPVDEEECNNFCCACGRRLNWND